MDGSFTRWTDPVPSNLPSPIASDAVQAKKLERLLDDDFGDDDLDLEDQGEDLADDWLVDDDGGYLAEDGENAKRSGRELGKSISKRIPTDIGRLELMDLVNATKAQPSFTPGSTSMRNKKRYLGKLFFRTCTLLKLIISVQHDWCGRRHGSRDASCHQCRVPRQVS